MHVPNTLSYSCIFWAAHLGDTASTQAERDILLKEIKDFLHDRVPYWMEVMSLLLLTAIPWIETSESDTNISAFARDASRFIINFGTLIFVSAPHIYLSALPFSPSESLVAKQYQKRLPNTVSVISGRDRKRPAMVNIFREHYGSVSSVSVSSDGTRVVSGSNDKSIHVWDAKAGQLCAGPFHGHKKQVTSVAFSLDGQRVVSGSLDKTIRVWNVEAGRVSSADPLSGHTDEVTSAVFSSDGNHVISGSLDNMVGMWDIDTGDVSTSTLEWNPYKVASSAFSSDGKHFASDLWDNTIRVWDVKTGQLSAGPFVDYTDGVTSIAFSQDCKRIVSGSRDKTIRVWNIERGKPSAGPFAGRIYGVYLFPLLHSGWQGCRVKLVGLGHSQMDNKKAARVCLGHA